jgi:hypothetical protein
MNKPDTDECFTIDQTLSWIIHRDRSFPPINRAQRRRAMRELNKAIAEGDVEPIILPDPTERPN